MSATQSHHQVSGVQEAADTGGKARLRSFQVAIKALDVPAVIEGCGIKDWQIGHHLAQCGRARCCAHTPTISADAFIARKAQDGSAGCVVSS
jgi:hypothetical protein